MRKFYSIMAPPYDLTSGGIRVCYALRSWLETKGQEVYMNATSQNKNFVAVYPEIYPPTNETGANTVVRYILNKVGTMALYGQPGPTEFNPNDKIYVFSRLFDTFGVSDDHILFLPILDLHIFKDRGGKRNKTCYMVGKGVNKNKHPEDAIEITRQFSTDQQALADLFNECQAFYCYDKVTAQMEIARLCGCPVKYYGDYTRDELKKYEPGLNGISFDGDDVPLDSHGFREHYIVLRTTFSRRLEGFIENTQS